MSTEREIKAAGMEIDKENGWIDRNFVELEKVLIELNNDVADLSEALGEVCVSPAPSTGISELEKDDRNQSLLAKKIATATGRVRDTHEIVKSMYRLLDL